MLPHEHLSLHGGHAWDPERETWEMAMLQQPTSLNRIHVQRLNRATNQTFRKSTRDKSRNWVTDGPVCPVLLPWLPRQDHQQYKCYTVLIMIIRLNINAPLTYTTRGMCLYTCWTSSTIRTNCCSSRSCCTVIYYCSMLQDVNSI